MYFLSNTLRWRQAAGSILAAFFLFAPPLLAQSPEPARTVEVRWQAVAGAAAYQLQIRRQGSEENLVDQRLRQNQYAAQLAPGSYEQRLSAVNPAGRQGPWSRWTPLEVRASRRPIIGVVQPQGQANESGRQTVRVEGLYFTPDTRLSVRNTLNQTPVAVPVRPTGEPGVLETEFDPAILNDGRYSLVVENPRQQRAEVALVAVVANERVTIPEEVQQPTEEYERLREQAQREARSEESQREISALDIWLSLAPGLPGFYRGETLNGALWATAFAAPIAGIFLEYQAGENSRAAFQADLLTQFVTNPAIAVAISNAAGGGRPSNEAVAALIFQHNANEAAARATYLRHQQNQIYLAALASLVYLYHFYEESGQELLAGAAPLPDEEIQRSAARSSWQSAGRPYRMSGRTGLDEMQARSQIWRDEESVERAPLILLSF